MAKQKKGEGFQSAAGLIRYFDAEEGTALQFSRWGVVMACVLLVTVVEVARAMDLITAGYVLAGGFGLMLLIEWRIHRSENL